MKKKKSGITSDPARREKELKREFSGMSNFKVEEKFPSQKAAQKWENAQKNQHPGGPKTSGPFYGYSFNYNRKRPGK